MSRTSFTVTGRITRKDTNAGVHGLRVKSGMTSSLPISSLAVV